jgi:hypothetical protein
MNKSVDAASYKKWIFICTLYRVNFRVGRDCPYSAFPYIPKTDLSTSRADQNKLVIELEPRSIENGILEYLSLLLFLTKELRFLY